MNPFEMIVVLTAMILGYKLMSQVIGAVGKGRAGKERKVKERIVFREDPGELQARTQELNRRLATLEEILVSDRESRDESQ